jgi:hypothetical protein
LENAIEIGGEVCIRDAKEDQAFYDIRNVECFKILIKNIGA